MILLELKKFSCGYDKIDIIKNIDFKAKRGEILCIVGPNGCGKSTLLKAIGRLIEYKGTLTFDSKDIKNLPVKEFAKTHCTYDSK